MSFWDSLLAMIRNRGVSVSVKLGSGYTVKSRPPLIYKPSPNYHHGRMYPITCVVLHATATPGIDSPLAWLCNKESGVSAHYLIGKDGLLYQLVHETDIAWHAGTSEFQGRQNVNAFSVGIEMVNNNVGEDYPEAQLNACAQLVAAICQEHGIPKDNVVSHAQVATPPGRKNDPFKFPWDDFRTRI